MSRRNYRPAGHTCYPRLAYCLHHPRYRVVWRTNLWWQVFEPGCATPSAALFGRDKALAVARRWAREDQLAAIEAQPQETPC